MNYVIKFGRTFRTKGRNEKRTHTFSRGSEKKKLRARTGRRWKDKAKRWP